MFQIRPVAFKIIIMIIGLFGPTLAAQPHLPTIVKDAARLLSGRGDVKLQLSSQTQYQVFFPENHIVLERLVNLIHEDLLRTPFGQKMISQNLKCAPQLIQSQLGLRIETVERLTSRCHPQAEPRKATQSGRPERLFAFLISDEPTEPFESWSEPHRNRTAILLTRSQLRHPLELKNFLYRALAHEMAIVLDGKSWPFGVAWEGDEHLAQLTIVAADSQEAAVAALNPLINTTFSLIRAFKVEYELLKDLTDFPADEMWKNPPYKSCIDSCLESQLKEHSAWLINLSVPLLVWSPHYRAHRFAKISKNDSRLFNEVQSHIAEHILNHGAEASLLQLLLSANLPPPPAIRHLLLNDLLPEDLKTLSDALVVEKSGRTTSLLNFLAEPYLTPDGNILAHGPRPRIRGGYTR